MSKTTKIGRNAGSRNAGSGKFTTVKVATSKPSTHVVETIRTEK